MCCSRCTTPDEKLNGVQFSVNTSYEVLNLNTIFYISVQCCMSV